MLGPQFRLVWCGLTMLLTDNCISFTKTPHSGVFFVVKNKLAPHICIKYLHGR